ncbi:kinase [Marinobacter fonticola]|uniref:kinase n=1 Tax=Marinobacter fonticola TaxID=2603215 RepID=UPI0011E79E8A|nr:kinase [Marinobacter fonticola]
MSDSERRYSARALLVTFFLTVVGTILVLESTGRIVHTEDKAEVPVGEFRAIYVGPREDYRMSPKPSELHAECYRGYLAIGSDTDSTLTGLLVDYKNRGVRCFAGPQPPSADSAIPDNDSNEPTE